MPQTYKEALREKFEKEFYLDGVTYKGSRHWKDNQKHCLVVNWFISEFDQHLERLEGELGKLSNRQSNRDQYGMGYLTALLDILTIIKGK